MTSRRREERKSISKTCFETINHNQSRFLWMCKLQHFPFDCHLAPTAILSQFRAFQNINSGTNHLNPLWVKIIFNFTLPLFFRGLQIEPHTAAVSLGCFYFYFKTAIRSKLASKLASRETTTIKINVHYAFLPKEFIVAYLSVCVIRV